MAPNTADTKADGGDVVDDVEQAVQDDPLVALVGDHAKARILMALLDAHPRPLNPTDVVENGAIGSRQTWYDYKDELLATGLIEQTGKAGNSPLFGLAEDDRRLVALEELRGLTRDELHGAEESA